MPADPSVKEIPFQPSTVETIDQAIYKWLDQEMNIFCTTNDGFEKVPTIWVSAERAFMSKNNREYRDEEGGIVFPAITIERSSMIKDPAFKGIVQANVVSHGDYRNGALPVARRMNQLKTADSPTKIQLENEVFSITLSLGNHPVKALAMASSTLNIKKKISKLFITPILCRPQFM